MSSILYNLFENFEKKRKYLEDIVSAEVLQWNPEMLAEDLERYIKVVMDALYKADPVCVKTKGKKTPYVNIALKFWQNDSFNPEEDVEKTHDLFKDYNSKKMSGHLLDPIESFDTFGDLYEYLQADSTPDKFYDTYLNKIYETDKYKMFLITEWEDGKRAFRDSGWCVQREAMFKTMYHPNEYFMITDHKNNRKALLHFNSRQLKNVFDQTFTTENKEYDSKVIDLIIGWTQTDPNPFKIFQLLPMEGSFTDEQKNFIASKVIQEVNSPSNNPVDFILLNSASINVPTEGIYANILNSIRVPTQQEVIERLDELITNKIGVYNTPKYGGPREDYIDFSVEVFTKGEIPKAVAEIVLQNDSSDPTYVKASEYLIQMYMALYAPPGEYSDPTIQEALNKIAFSENSILSEDSTKDMFAFYFRMALENNDEANLKHIIGLIFKSDEEFANEILRLLCLKVESRISIDNTGTQEKIDPSWPLGKLLSFSQRNREFITSIAKKSTKINCNVYIKFCTDQLIQDKDVTRILSTISESATFKYSDSMFRGLNDNHFQMFSIPKPEFQGNLNNVKAATILPESSNIVEFLKGDVKGLYTITFGNYIRAFKLEKLAGQSADAIMASFNPADHGDWATLLRATSANCPINFLTKLHLGKSYTNVGGVLGIKVEDINMVFDSQLIEEQDISAIYDIYEDLGVEWDCVYLIPKNNTVSLLFIGTPKKNTTFTRVDNKQNVAYFVKNYTSGAVNRYVYHMHGREVWGNSKIKDFKNRR
jgi:ubiquinone biosynthesis protein COQ9